MTRLSVISKMNKVVISEQAFVFMLGAAAEVYDKETYGTLLGYKRKKDFYIQYAITYQTTYRNKDEVSVNKKAEKRLLGSINSLKGYKYIGEFHSHPNEACALSKHDIQDMRDSGDVISTLISIEKTGKFRQWKYLTKDRCLVGTIGNEYLVRIKSYLCEHSSKKLFKLRLGCNFIKKLNKKAKKIV